MWVQARARAVAAVAAALYVATLVAAPLVDRDRDVLRSYPEDYAAGPAGALVRSGYVAVAVMALAIAVSIARQPSWSLRLALGLLGAGSLTALILAATPQMVSGGLLLVGVLGLALAPAAISAGARDQLPRVVVTIGLITTIAFVALAIGPRDIAGLTNRAWDVLLGLWGAAFALIRGTTATHDPRQAER